MREEGGEAGGSECDPGSLLCVSAGESTRGKALNYGLIVIAPKLRTF